MIFHFPHSNKNFTTSRLVFWDNPGVESGMAQSTEAKSEVNDDKTVADLREKLSRLIDQTDAFAEPDKKLAKESLLDQDAQKKENLQARIDHIEKKDLSESVEKKVTAFGKQIDEQIKLRLFSPKSKKAYIEWFRKEVGFMDKQDYIDKKSTDLHDPKRQEILDQWDHKVPVKGFDFKLPKAIAKENEKEFLDMDLQEREKFLIKIATKHKGLRDEFHKLPEEVQKKYAEAFQKSGLKGREKLLQSTIYPALKDKPSGPNTKEHSENAEDRELTQQYKNKSGEMRTKKLLSDKSKAEYDAWFEKLPLDKKKEMLTKSELTTRMADRERTRDEFYKMPEKDRKQHEPIFLAMDLDDRIDFLKTLKGETVTKKAKVTEYPRSHVQNVLKDIINNPAMHEQRAIYTILKTRITERKRAELRLNAKSVDDLSRKAQEQGLEGVQERTELARTRLMHQNENEPDKREKLSAFDQAAEMRKKRTEARDQGKKVIAAPTPERENAPRLTQRNPEPGLEQIRMEAPTAPAEKEKKPGLLSRLLGRKKGGIEANPLQKDTQPQDIPQSDKRAALEEEAKKRHQEAPLGVEHHVQQELPQRAHTEAPQQLAQQQDQEPQQEPELIQVDQTAEEEQVFSQLRLSDLERHHDVVYSEKRSLVETNKLLTNKYALDTTTIFMSRDNQRIMHDAHQAEIELLLPEQQKLDAKVTEDAKAALPGISEEALAREIAMLDYTLDFTQAGN